MRKLCIVSTLAAATMILCSCGSSQPNLISEQDEIVRFEVISCDDSVLHRGMPETADIKYGFEGGRVVKVGDTYHMITTEMSGDPFSVATRTGHWTSKDAVKWTRQGSLRESDADFTGTSQRAAIWGPMVVFVEEDNRWHLFYVCYKAKPNTEETFHANHDGLIQHAISDVAGIDGIGGPYSDREVLMRYDVDPDPWEGYQGVDSFFPYKIGKKWYAFYGSSTSQHMPTCNWNIGLAEADRIEGPWKRMSERNPVDPDNFAENPIVMQLDNGVYIAIVDGGPWVDKMGYLLSWDGVNWSNVRYFEIEPAVSKWWNALRTPMSLIKEKDGTYTMLFTAHKHYGSEVFGLLSKLKLKATFIE